MTTQLWTLVGIGVGAVLGGFAQVVNDWLRARREQAQTLRGERREAYASLLDSVNHVMVVMGSTRPDKKVRHEEFQEYSRVGMALYPSVSRVALVAPPDTGAAASELGDAVRSWSLLDVDARADQDETVRLAEELFMIHARRDLGVTREVGSDTGDVQTLNLGTIRL